MKHPLIPRLRSAALAALLAATVAVPAQAQKPPAPKGPVAAAPAVFSQVVEMEREITLADGSKKTERVPATKVAPGEQVIYTSRIRNTGKQPLTDLRLDAPVPQHTTLVGGSVFGEVSALYSVDGGKHFAPLAELKVTKNGNPVPATLADVTHLRLLPTQAVPAGGTLEAGYRVTVD